MNLRDIINRFRPSARYITKEEIAKLARFDRLLAAAEHMSDFCWPNREWRGTRNFKKVLEPARRLFDEVESAQEFISRSKV